MSTTNPPHGIDDFVKSPISALCAFSQNFTYAKYSAFFELAQALILNFLQSRLNKAFYECIGIELDTFPSGWNYGRVKRKTIISLAVGIILSAFGFYYAFANVPLSELIWYMGTVSYVWILPAAVLGLSNFFLRALRWRVILGTSVRLPFSPVYHATMIGFMVNSVLPARVGEIVRPAIIKKKENVPFSFGVSTLVTERILDAFTLIAMFAWMMAVVDIDPDLTVEVLGYHLSRTVLENAASGMITFSLAVAAVVVLMNITVFQHLLKTGILKIPGLFIFFGSNVRETIYNRFCIPLTGIIDNVVAGMSLVRFPEKLLLCVFYSAIIWLLQAGAFYITAIGSPSIELSFTELTTVFVIICFFIMLPSVPGYWGIFEAGGVFGLALFGVAAREALGFTLTVHAVLMFPVLIAGLVSLVMSGTRIFRTAAPATDIPKPEKP